MPTASAGASPRPPANPARRRPIPQNRPSGSRTTKNPRHRWRGFSNDASWDQPADEDDAAIGAASDDEAGAIGAASDDEAGAADDEAGAIGAASDDEAGAIGVASDEEAAAEDEASDELTTAELAVTTVVVLPPRLKIQMRPMMTITATMMIIQVLRFMGFALGLRKFDREEF
jgi:hypothetical protein